VKLSRRKLVLLVIALCGLFAGVWITWHFWRAKRAVIAYRKELIAAGERLTIKQLLPPAIPEDQNGAELFRKAYALIASQRDNLLETNSPTGMRTIAPGRAMIRWQQPEILEIPDAKSTNSWAEVEAELAKIAPSIDLLDQLAEHRALDFSYDYFQGFQGLLPNLAPLKHSTQLLNYATVFALHEGDSAAACTHLRGMLALSRANADERLAISQLVRFAINSITLTATWEFLQATNITDGQLAALQRDWQELEFITATENAFMMERAISEMTLDDMRQSSDEFRNVTSGFGLGGGSGAGGGSGLVGTVKDFAERTWEGTKEKSKEMAWRVAWSYPDQLRMLQGKQVLIESLRFVRTNQNFAVALATQQQQLAVLGFTDAEADDSFGWLSGDMDLQHLFSSGVQSLEKVINKVLTAEAGRQIVLAAIALKRHHLRHGAFPATLPALVPEFLSEVPTDPGDGKPLRYRLNADGSFQLYSIGKDGEDNGGDPQNPNPKSNAKFWQMGRDWVWPQPATDAEIAALLMPKPR